MIEERGDSELLRTEQYRASHPWRRRSFFPDGWCRVCVSRSSGRPRSARKCNARDSKGDVRVGRGPPGLDGSVVRSLGSNTGSTVHGFPRCRRCGLREALNKGRFVSSLPSGSVSWTRLVVFGSELSDGRPRRCGRRFTSRTASYCLSSPLHHRPSHPYRKLSPAATVAASRPFINRCRRHLVSSSSQSDHHLIHQVPPNPPPTSAPFSRAVLV